MFLPKLLFRINFLFYRKSLLEVSFTAVSVFGDFPVMIFYLMTKNIVFESILAQRLILLSIALCNEFGVVNNEIGKLHPFSV